MQNQMYSVHVSIHKITRKYILGKLSGASLEILRIKKPEAVKSPKIFVWLDVPRKRTKTKKTKGFLLAVNYYCVYD